MRLICSWSFIMTTMVDITLCVALPCVWLNSSAVVLNSWCLSNRVRSATFYWYCCQDSTNMILVAFVRKVLTFLENYTHTYLTSVHCRNVTTPVRKQSQCTHIKCKYFLYLHVLVPLHVDMPMYLRCFQMKTKITQTRQLQYYSTLRFPIQISPFVGLLRRVSCLSLSLCPSKTSICGALWETEYIDSR